MLSRMANRTAFFLRGGGFGRFVMQLVQRSGRAGYLRSTETLDRLCEGVFAVTEGGSSF